MSQALFFALGTAFGCGLYHLIWVKAFSITARYQRTGHVTPDAPTQAEDGERGTIPVNVEYSASRRLHADAVETGAKALLEFAKAEGVSMSREEARAEAARLIHQARGDSPLGGTV